MKVRTGTLRYVAEHDIERFLNMGWMVTADLGPVHGAWSVIMWRCDCRSAP